MMKVNDVSILCGFVDSFDAERNTKHPEGKRRLLSSKFYVFYVVLCMCICHNRSLGIFYRNGQCVNISMVYFSLYENWNTGDFYHA